MMKSSDPDDHDLRSLFHSLRSAEQREAPPFHTTLAAARSRESFSIVSRRLAWSAGVLAGAFALALLLLPDFAEEGSSRSLAETIPTLLPEGSEEIIFLPGPLFSDAAVPSDILLPLSSRFPL